MSGARFKGKSRWLTRSTGLAIIGGVGLAALHAWARFDLPDDSRVSCFVSIGVTWLVANALLGWLEQRRLVALRQLGVGAPPTPQMLTRAAVEVRTQPLYTFWLVLWLMGG